MGGFGSTVLLYSAAFGHRALGVREVHRAADNLIMSAVPPPGTPVIIVPRTANPRQLQGELIAFKDATMAVRIHGDPGPWDPSLRYSVIWGAPGSRSICNVSFVASKDSAVALRVTSALKAIDLRRDQRFNFDLNVEVRSVLGSSRQTGRLIDISAGGAAVSVDARPGGSQIEVGLQANGYSARVLCDVVDTHVSGDQTVLHLRFRDLSPAQQAFVRNLVGRLVESQAS